MHPSIRAITSRARFICLLLSAGLCLGAVPPASGFVADPEKDLPALERLEIFQPGEPSILYAAQEEPFASLAQEFRIYVPLSRVPKLVQQAVLDIEDTQFYEHGAISLKGMARAALRNLSSGKVKEGGSTITQQLAKGLFLSPERTLQRKMKEIQYAAEIERLYRKDKILEMYLNTIYFGSGAYGIEAGARTYFSKSVGQLNLPEAALLAGVVKAPSLYSPLVDVKRAKSRRDVVLGRMKALGHISPAQAHSAISAPVNLKPFFKGRGVASHFVDHVRKELEPRYGRALLARGGLRIHTTLDLETQQIALDVLRSGVKGIEKTLSSRRKESQREPAGLEGALVAIEPTTGEIRAMVGGLDYAKSQFNRVVQARRQPGSTFKPFVYAAAFERGFTPATVVDDFPVSFSIPQNGRYVEWSPENFDHQFRGAVTLRHALEESINVPTVRLLEAVGVDPVIRLARSMGIKSDLRAEYGLALGVSEVNALELTAAYAVLGNQGIRVPPTGIRRIVGANGEVLEAASRAGDRVLHEEVAFMMTSLLQGAVERGTAKRGRVPGWTVAAKTGTSQDAVDLWFVGYTPKLAAGLWVGYDRPRAVGSHETAGRLAAPVWADFMRRALRGVPRDTIPIPEGLLPVRVNYRTGLPTDPSDPAAITEYFIRGALPERDAPPGFPAPQSEGPPAALAPPARPASPRISLSPGPRPTPTGFPPVQTSPVVPLPPPLSRTPLPPPPPAASAGAPRLRGGPSPVAPRQPAIPVAPLPDGASAR
jgi:penicillin-binding protein 1A